MLCVLQFWSKNLHNVIVVQNVHLKDTVLFHKTQDFFEGLVKKTFQDFCFCVWAFVEPSLWRKAKESIYLKRYQKKTNLRNWNEWEKQHGHAIRTCRTGRQSRPEELIYTMPLRDTVAGEALSMLWGSKMILHWGDMGIRSPLARVSVLLSSRTLFRFSIQIASTGPSNTIQMRSPKEYKKSINQPIRVTGNS